MPFNVWEGAVADAAPRSNDRVGRERTRAESVDYWLAPDLEGTEMLNWIAANADAILAAAAVVYAVAFLPQVFYQARIRACTVPLTTSIPFLLATCTMGIVFATLSMWLTAGIDVLMVFLWLVVIAQRIVYRDGST